MDNLNHPMEKVANFRICKRRIKYNSRIIRHGTEAGTTNKGSPLPRTVSGQSYPNYDKIV